MTTEFPFGHLLSKIANSVQDLAKKSSAENRRLKLNELPKQLQQIWKQSHIRLMDRATVRICHSCYRPIRPWDSRVAESCSFFHGNCWKSQQLIRELMRYHAGNTSLEPPELLRATGLIESIVCSFYDEVGRRGTDNPQCEYIRGMLSGAKSMLAELRDQATQKHVLNEARRHVGKPFPSIIPLAEDGNRYGWDIETEAGSP